MMHRLSGIGLVAVAACLLFMLGQRDAQVLESALEARAVAALPAATSDAGVCRDAAKTRLVLVRDRLSGQPLTMDIVAVQPDGSSSVLAAGECRDLSGLPAGTVLRHALHPESAPGAISDALADAWIEDRIEDCLIDDGSSWILELSHSCRVVPEVLPGLRPPAPGPVRWVVCADPRTGEDGLVGAPPYHLPAARMTPAGAWCWIQRRDKALLLGEAFSFDATPVPLDAMGIGPALVVALFEGGGIAAGEVLLDPGRELHVAMHPRLRPQLSGRLLDPDGEPVPDALLTLTAELDMADYDLGGPYGMAAIRRKDGMHHMAKRGLRTDAEGRFSIEPLCGKSYAFDAHLEGCRAFWSSAAAALPPDGRQEIELRLEAPTPENSVRITVLDHLGAPLPDASLEVQVVSDVPALRGWPPGQKPDADGGFVLTGLEPGMLIGVIVRHPKLTRPLYAPPYPTVPADRRLVVQVPEDCFLPSEAQG